MQCLSGGEDTAAMPGRSVFVPFLHGVYPVGTPSGVKYGNREQRGGRMEVQITHA
jgi:hypothetical protein